MSKEESEGRTAASSESPDAGIEPREVSVVFEPGAPAEHPWLEELLSRWARKGSILLIDDDACVRELLCGVLEREGYEVHDGGDGAECLRMAKTLRPDLIVLNYLMPVMDGMTALRLLKEDPIIAYLRVVMFSAVSDFARFRAIAIEAGALDCLQTPFGVKSFLAMVRSALGDN